MASEFNTESFGMAGNCDVHAHIVSIYQFFQCVSRDEYFLQS